MSLKDEAQDYCDLPDQEQETAAIRAFQKLEAIDQFRLMLWLSKRDAGLCEQRIFIEFCKHPDIQELVLI
jgi:hypothetical protein